VKTFVEKHGIENCGFLTMTCGDKGGVTIKEFQRRFNSFATRVLRRRYSAYIMVMERGDKSGLIHAHLLVNVGRDIRSGFNFEAVKNRNYRSASAAIRAEWAFFRETAPKYKFGRCELLPIRSNAKGISKYLAKYIAKSVGKRLNQDRRARLVRYSRNGSTCSTNFQFVSDRSYLWRKKIAALSRKFGFSSFEDWKNAFGEKWAHHLADAISALTLGEYATKNAAAADGQSVRDLPDDCEQIRVAGRANCIDVQSKDQLEQYLRKDYSAISVLKKLGQALAEITGVYDLKEVCAGLKKGFEQRYFEDGEWKWREILEFRQDPDWSVF
jgi:hypothetical protein